MRRFDLLGSAVTALGIALLTAGVLTVVYACTWEPDYYTLGDRYWAQPFTPYEYYGFGTVLTALGIGAVAFGFLKPRPDRIGPSSSSQLRTLLKALAISGLASGITGAGLYFVSSLPSPPSGERAQSLRAAEDVAIRFLANTPTPSVDANALITLDYRSKLTLPDSYQKQFGFARFRVGTRELSEAGDQATITGTIEATWFISSRYDKAGALSGGGRYEKPKTIPFHIRVIRLPIEGDRAVPIWRVDGAEFEEKKG